MRTQLPLALSLAAALACASSSTARADRYGRGLMAFQSQCARCHSIAWSAAGAPEKTRVDLTRIVDRKNDGALQAWLMDPAHATKSSACRYPALTVEQSGDLLHFLHTRAIAPPRPPKLAPRSNHRQVAPAVKRATAAIITNRSGR